MPIEILMPALSPTMTEGNLAKWHIKVGDTVKSGKVIAEIETDKATMEVEAVDEGVVGKLLIAEGAQSVKVNQVIALLLAEGEDKSAIDKYTPKAAPAPKAEAVATLVVAPAPAQQTLSAPAPSFNLPTKSATPAPRISSGGKVFATPLAKRVAEQEGVDVGSLQGTGPNGRVVVADVLEGKNRGVGMGASRRVMRHPTEYVTIPNNNMRKVIAKRLTESKQWVPHFYLNVDVNLDRLLDVRKELNGEAVSDAGKDGKPAFKLSVNDFIIKAVGMAMKKVPAANASWTDEAIVQYNNIDISVAVAIDGGLITPIVANADQKTVIAISNEMKDLAARARQGKLKPEEFQGGGFSISNLGMYGVKNFNAIINPPQGCILAVGAGEERVIVKGGEMGIATMMDCTLSVDHRVVDGAVGAEFLAAFKRYIESPSLLLV